MDITSILEKVDSEMFGIWFLIGAALVFFMQGGFAVGLDDSDAARAVVRQLFVDRQLLALEARR